jgi:coenzyme F420-reducing hydrogenase gamma subunit
MAKPKVGIFGLTGCAGDQLVVLNCEDELLQLVDLLDIRSFVMASSDPDEETELDIALVEGAVVTDRDAELLQRIRKRSRLLIALGTCAVWGGIAAHGEGNWALMLGQVYGDMAERYRASQARSLSECVKVDAAITGCPIEKHELIAALSQLLNGNLPVFAHYPVCTECKMRENECLLVSSNAFCVGPLTVAGCNARCPTLGVACIGCRGPAPDANFEYAKCLFATKGYDEQEIARRLHAFTQSPSLPVPESQMVAV